MAKPLSNELKKQMIEWYLEEDERSLLDVAFEFGVAYNTAQKFIKEAEVGKSPYRNAKNKNIPASDGRSKPSVKPNIAKVSTKAHFRSHRRRSQY